MGKVKAIVVGLFFLAAFLGAQYMPPAGGGSGGGSITINGTSCTVGSTCTVAGAPNGTAGGVLAGTYPNPTLATLNQDLLFVDGTRDIGKPGATRPRDIYASRYIATDGDIIADGEISGGTLSMSGDADFNGNISAGGGDITEVQLLQAANVQGDLFSSVANCSSAASPAACSSASLGSVTVAAAATSVVVETTAVTANSQILLTFDQSLSAKLGVTCNSTVPSAYWVSARTALTSFTISSTAPIANPACFSFFIIN